MIDIQCALSTVFIVTTGDADSEVQLIVSTDKYSLKVQSPTSLAILLTVAAALGNFILYDT